MLSLNASSALARSPLRMQNVAKSYHTAGRCVSLADTIRSWWSFSARSHCSLTSYSAASAFSSASAASGVFSTTSSLWLKRVARATCISSTRYM